MRYEEKWWNDHFDEYVEVLSGYVSCRSIAIPSDDSDAPFGLECHRMLEYMKNTMSSYGLDSKIYDHVFVDGVLHGSGGEKSKSIAIICHGDVVAAEGQWDEDPFKLYFKDDHLVGRGTTDNKGAAIAVLFAIRCLLENGWKPYNDFILRIGSAEEIGMRDVPLAKNLPKADLCLVPDSGFPVAYGEKGSIKAVFSFPWKSSLSISGGNGTSVIDMARAEFPDDVGFRKTDCPDDIEYLGSCVFAYGIARHPAMPEGGKDAVIPLLEFLLKNRLVDNVDDMAVLAEIRSLFGTFYGEGLEINISDKQSGRLTAVLTGIVTEKDKIECTINIRVPCSFSAVVLAKDLEKRFRNCTIISCSDGFVREIDDIVEKLNSIACEEYGVEKPPYIMSGGTYARMFEHAIAYGMGSPLGNVIPPFPVGQGRAHQRNESVHIERMKKGFSIYIKAMKFLDASI